MLPNPDINSFSLSLPNGSFSLFTTEGIADKIDSSQREAIMAYEIAHMLSGDNFFKP
ncbi:MAG: hypothetical protein SWK76_02780 [Actinomycetota bacterium]|nr:hypothetical protein [Actinomycetota bacterium]